MSKLLTNQRGVTMMEYALIAALVAIAAITIVSTLGTSLSSVFSHVNVAINPVKPSAA